MPKSSYKKIIYTIAAGCLSLSASSSAYAYNLQDAMSQALSGSNNIQAAQETLRAHETDARKAYSGLLPEIALSLEKKETKFDIPQHRAYDVKAYKSSKAVTIQQSLFSGGSTIASIKQQDYARKAVEASFRATVSDVMLDVVKAYEEVLTARETLEMQKKNEEAIAKELEIAVSRFKVGAVTKTDVLIAKAQLAKAEAERIGALGNVSQAEANFVNIVGVEPPADMDIISKGTVKEPENLEELLSSTLSHNNKILEAEYNYKASKYAIKAHLGKNLPQVSAQARYLKHKDTQRPSDPKYIREFTVQAQIPISPSNYFDVSKAKAQSRGASHQLNHTKASTQTKLINSWYQYNTAKASIDSWKEEIKSREKVLEGTKEEAKIGSKTTKDILDAENRLLVAKIGLRRAKRDQIVALCTFWNITGTLETLLKSNEQPAEQPS